MSDRKVARVLNLTAIGAATSIAAIIAASAAPRDAFQVHLLDSSGGQAGTLADTDLVNAWGLAASPTGPWWVSSNAMNLGVVISGTGAAQGLTVEIPGAPTGVVFNGGNEFKITDGESRGPARFLFATEDGTIVGWNPGVPEGNISRQTFIAVDSTVDGAVYKGLAIATTAQGDRLYAADFRNGRIDVFDGNFDPVTLPEAFIDPRIPEGFSPFNVQNLNGRIVVAYARRDPATNDEVKGPGLGIVDVYDTEGMLLARAATHGLLDAPWGLAIAPKGFGRLAGDLLVGNFGDGRIVAYRMSDDMKSFAPAGVLRDERSRPISIEGLWGIGFGNGGQAGPADTLFFAAGPRDEEAGLFGSITPAP